MHRYSTASPVFVLSCLTWQYLQIHPGQLVQAVQAAAQRGQTSKLPAVEGTWAFAFWACPCSQLKEGCLLSQDSPKQNPTMFSLGDSLSTIIIFFCCKANLENLSSPFPSFQDIYPSPMLCWHSCLPCNAPNLISKMIQLSKHATNRFVKPVFLHGLPYMAATEVTSAHWKGGELQNGDGEGGLRKNVQLLKAALQAEITPTGCQSCPWSSCGLP